MSEANLRFKPVFRYDSDLKWLRLFRFMWERGTVGDGSGYSAKLSFALVPHLIGYRRDVMQERVIVFLGVRIHYQRSYGGVFA